MQVAVNSEISLDEEQRQLEAVRSPLADHYASFTCPECLIAKLKSNVHNLGEKIDAALHKANQILEKVNLLMVFCNIFCR